MENNNDKTLMRAIDINIFNEDMKLLGEYSKLIRNKLMKVTVDKEFYMEELKECRHMINCILCYSNLIRENDLKSARNCLRTTIANGSMAQMSENISQELKNILDNDKYWNEEIVKSQVQDVISDQDKDKITSELTELWNDDNFWGKETK